MPILSSYAPASEKIAIPLASASSRAGSEDSKTRFKSLLDSITPAAASSSSKSKAVAVSTLAAKSKNEAAKRKESSSSAKRKTDPDDSEIKNDPKNQNPDDVQTQQSDDVSENQDATSETRQNGETEDSQMQEADPSVESTQDQTLETEGSEDQSAGKLAAELALLNPQSTQQDAVDADDSVNTDDEAQKVEKTDPTDATLQAQATAAAVQQTQTTPLAQCESAVQEETEQTASEASVQPANVDVAQAATETAKTDKTSSRPVESDASAKSEKTKALELEKTRLNSEIQEDSTTGTDETLPADEFGKMLEKILPRENSEENALALQTPVMDKSVQDAVQPAQTTQTTPSGALEKNQDQIITGIQSQITTKGGSMRILLDPPELGAMQVKVEIRGEMVSATFQTSNDQAAMLLTHGLGQLKSALERQGLSVDRLQVQTTKSETDNNSQTGDSSNQSSTAWQGYQNQQDQQRRQALNRMWKQAAFGRDPLDMVA
jgi:flagellar hook-length control protein FliK